MRRLLRRLNFLAGFVEENEARRRLEPTRTTRLAENDAAVSPKHGGSFLRLWREENEEKMFVLSLRDCRPSRQSSLIESELSRRTRHQMLLWSYAVALRGELQPFVMLPASSVAPALSPSPGNPEQSLSASEEDVEAGERSSPQSPTLLALCRSPPSSPELHPVRGVESIRVSPLLLGEYAVDFGWPRETQNRCSVVVLEGASIGL